MTIKDPNAATAPTGTPTPTPAAGAPPTPASAAPTPAPTPAPAAAPTAAAQAPAAPGTMFHNLSHSFMGAVLGALAGRKETSYKVDNNPDSPNYGQTMAINSDMSHGDQLKKIASAALTGLAAGASVPRDKNSSGLARGLAGLGAGGVAEENKEKEADALKRKNANESFESQQRALVNKSNMAHMNGAALTNWFANVKAGNDMDPLIQHDKSEFQAVMDSPELGHGNIMTDKEVEQAMQNDPHWATEHAVYHLGRSAVTDAQGQPVKDAQGNPISEVKLGVVAAHDGKYQVPQSFIDDLQQYGKYSGSMDQADIDRWKAGMEVPFNDYVQAKAHLLAGENKVLSGWANPTTVWSEDGKTPMQRNSTTGEIRPWQEGVVPNVKNEPAESLATVAQKNAAAQKSLSGAALDEAQVKSLHELGINLPTGFQPNPNAFTQSLDQIQTDMTAKGIKVPSDLPSLYAVGHYKAGMDTFTTSPRKGVPAVTKDQAQTMIRNFVNPKFDENNYSAVKEMEKEFASTKPSTAGGSLIAFNTATGHLGQLHQAAVALENGDIPALNAIAKQWGIQTGQAAPLIFNAIRGAVAEELDKTFKGGVADVAGTEDIKSNLNNAQSPQATDGLVNTYAHLMLTKAGELTNHYYALTGERPAESISPNAAQVYKSLGIDTEAVLGRGVVPMGQNGGATGAQTGAAQTPATSGANAPTPQTHVFDVGAWTKAHPGATAEQIANIKKTATDGGYTVKE